MPEAMTAWPTCTSSIDDAPKMWTARTRRVRGSTSSFRRPVRSPDISPRTRSPKRATPRTNGPAGADEILLVGPHRGDLGDRRDAEGQGRPRGGGGPAEGGEGRAAALVHRLDGAAAGADDDVAGGEDVRDGRAQGVVDGIRPAPGRPRPPAPGGPPRPRTPGPPAPPDPLELTGRLTGHHRRVGPRHARDAGRPPPGAGARPAGAWGPPAGRGRAPPAARAVAQPWEVENGLLPGRGVPGRLARDTARQSRSNPDGGAARLRISVAGPSPVRAAGGS